MSENEFSNVVLEFEYQLTDGTVSVDTPNTEKIDSFTIRKTAELIQRLSIYSNGFILYVEQDADKITLRTNRLLYQIGDGKFSIEDPEK